MHASTYVSTSIYMCIHISGYHEARAGQTAASRVEALETRLQVIYMHIYVHLFIYKYTYICISSSQARSPMLARDMRRRAGWRRLKRDCR